MKRVICLQAAMAVCASIVASSAGADVVTLAPARDATLYQSNDGSVANGSGQHLFAGRNSGGNTRRSLLAFDIAGAIPAGSTITGVTLDVNVSSFAGDTPTVINLHRVLSGWGEGASDAGGSEGGGAPSQSGDATWLHTFYDTDLWTTPGGDFDPLIAASTTMDQTGPYTVLSTPALVSHTQTWLDDPASNFGWIVRGDEVGFSTAVRLDSRENPDLSVRPTLTITYLVPAPGVACVVAAFLATHAVRRRPRRSSDSDPKETPR